MNQENSYSAPNVTRMKNSGRPGQLATVGRFPHNIAIKSYLILVMTDHYLLHLTVHIYITSYNVVPSLFRD